MKLKKSNSPATHSFAHRAVVFCSTVVALAVATVAPLRSAALAQLQKTSLQTTHSFRHSSKRTPGRAAHAGYWHTEGSRILSDRHAVVHISGVNWSGLETTAAMPGGLDRQDYHTILRSVADAGYNTIRIPFSNEMVESPTVPSAIRFENEAGPINADLEGLTSLQILDHVIFAAGELGLKVILDDHRSEAGSSAEANGLWYTGDYPEQAWIADWTTLASRYKGNSTVVGVDLRNEPHNATSGGACWDCGGDRDWHLAAERAGNAVLRVNPNLLIFVEGVDSYDGASYWWGGDLSGVRRSPVHLTVANRLAYSPHVYGPTEYQQPWFNAGTTPASLAEVWRRNWAYISESGIAPVWIGEFGTSNDALSIQNTEPGSQGQWFSTLTAYLRQHPNLGWSYWGINGEDRYGLLNASYTAAASPLKANLLASLRRPALAPAPVQSPATESAAVESPIESPAAMTAQDTDVVSPAAPEPANTIYSQPALVLPVDRVQQPELATRPVHDRASRPQSQAPRDAVAEQVRLATEQALHMLPSE